MRLSPRSGVNDLHHAQHVALVDQRRGDQAARLKGDQRVDLLVVLGLLGHVVVDLGRPGLDHLAGEALPGLVLDAQELLGVLADGGAEDLLVADLIQHDDAGGLGLHDRRGRVGDGPESFVKALGGVDGR
jgi:hypothetical protein